jgi:hypothetical protein
MPVDTEADGLRRVGILCVEVAHLSGDVVHRVRAVYQEYPKPALRDGGAALRASAPSAPAGAGRENNMFVLRRVGRWVLWVTP